ncbi:Alpha/Beta hydrolase protein [Colletotrichum phormii]|uniref:Carboxylic ester hydrolase n=1 Tax=Colletotrichum phormii TaxID=359342 RepID=A0AAJ0EFB0_9PEZI|nr:Alpha/Beta hydrolase protein [Colletotrichum phormii]KAK1637987.1 Alpha/Beta hydrolase protein [Colletotrichum phormii]
MKIQKKLLSSAVSSASLTAFPTATIFSGPIQGISTSRPNALSPVNKFLEIPYASIPERFSLPQPPKPWVDTLNATTFGPACLQNFGINAPPESEDCLSINVFAPTTRFPDAGLAVVVFIHGGGWQLGHGRLDLSAFAAYEDIVAVTLNYRTNVFGFPASPEIPPSEQNLGLHDQRLALAWVQDNIATFGGDPSKVTIWGQSAGSFSVDHHLKAYANDTLVPFRGAIMSSGQMSFGHLAHPSPGIEAWTGLSSLVGCANSSDELECMKAVPAKTLINTMRNKPGELWRNGDVVKIPILTGIVEEEGRGLVNDKVNMTAFFDAYLPSALVPSEDREMIISMYRSDPSVITDFDLASAIYTDLLWSCPQSILASTASSNNISTWRYHFNTSILNLLPKEYDWLGRFHGSEIILLFTDPDTTPYTPQTYAVYEYFRGVIARFVKNPSAGPGWPAVGSSYAPLDVAILGDVGDTSSVMTVSNSTRLDERCKLFEKIWPKLKAIS